MRLNKSLFLFFSCALLVCSQLSLAQTYQWVKFGKSQGFEYGNDVTTDESGNIYVTGQFEYTTLFDNISRPGAGQHDIFVAKYAPDGALLWVRTAGGTDGDAGSSIGVDAAGNAYITGEFEKTTKFTPTDSIVATSSNNNIFIAKYNTNGVFQWVRMMPSNSDGRGRAIAVDAAGYSYVSGAYSGTTNFGGVNLTGSGKQDIFIAKYTPNGNLVWARKAAGSQDDRGRDITLDKFGNVYLAATYTVSANFSGTTITDNSGSKMSGAVAKYDTSGTLKWVRSIGACCDTTRVYGPSTDEFGNVYVTGYFTDQTKLGNITLNGSGNMDAFIAKYDPNGNVLWAKKYGGAYEDYGNGSAVDTRRQLVYFTGMFDFRATFDSVTVSSVANRDAWLTAVDYDGNLKWIRTGGGTGRDAGYSVATDTSGNIFQTGYCTDTAYFGSHSVQGYPLADYFMAKISPAPEVSPTTASSLMNASITNCNDVQLMWNSGDGANRLVIARAGSGVNSLPVDGQGYDANTVFGQGSEIGNGNFVVYDGSGSSAIITGLSPGVTYHFTVIEYNGRNLFANYYTQNNPIANIIANSFQISANATTSVICQGAVTTLNASGAAVSYAWSPSGSLSSSSGSSVNAQPQITTTYTVTGTNSNGCQAATQVSVTVHPAPGVMLSSLQATCIGSNPFLLSGGAPSGGTYSGTGVSGGMFNPSVAGLGSHVITYSYTSSNGCSNSATSTQVVGANPVVSITGFSPVCESSGPFTLSGGSPAGGVYSGPGVSGGQFSASVAGTGTHTITYTYTSGTCSGSASTNISVNPGPVVSLSSFSPVCLSTPAFALSGGSPAGGTYTGTGVSSGNFNPSTAGVGIHSITYTVNSGGCVATISRNIEVLASPTVSLATFDDVCSNTPVFNLTGGSPLGGVYSGTGVSSGQFNPSLAGIGTHTITYSYSAGANCSASTQRNIVVKSAPSVSHSTLNPVCAGSATVALTGGSPGGGVYSGTGVTNNIFNPAIGAGSYNITYTVTGANACTASVSRTMLVNALPQVSLASLSPLCTNSSPLQLSGGSPSGGVYSGSGVNAGVFTPSSAPGTYVITYTYTDNNNCTSSSSGPLQVNPAPTVNLASFSPVCSNTSSVVLQGGTPGGGQYSGTGVSGGTFSPIQGAGSYNITYTFTNANSCSATAVSVMTVLAAPEINLGNDTVVCAENQVLLQVSQAFSSILWSNGSSASSLLVDSSGTGLGSKNVFVEVSNSSGCRDSDTIRITFDVCAGIDAPQNPLPSVYLYPNPFTNTIKILCERPVQVRIYDVSGRTLEVIQNVIGVVETGTELAAGTYFVEVSGNGHRKVYHIIKALR